MAVNEPKAKPAVRSAAARTVATAPQPAGYRGSPLSIQGIRSGVLHGTFVKIVLSLLIVIFGLGLAVNGLSNFNGGGARGAAGGAGPDPVAQVGSDSISRAQYMAASNQQLRMMQSFGQAVGVTDLIGTRQRALQQLAEATAMYQAAQNQGITVSDAEIDKKIDSEIDDSLKQDGKIDPATRRRIENEFGSVDAYRAKQKEGATAEGRDAVMRQLMTDKLEHKIKDANKVSEDDYKRSVTKLKLRVIKVASKVPLPTAKGAKPPTPTDNRAAAEALAAKLKAKPDLATFVAAVAANSADDATNKKAGDLGLKLPSELPYGQALKDALINAATSVVGPLQDEFVKDSYYIFFIESRKIDLPKDYLKKKAELIKTYKTQKDNEVWTHYQDDVKKTVKPQIADPELVAYQDQTEKALAAQPADAAKLRQEALDKYQEALAYAGGADTAAIHYQMAQLYRQMNQPAKTLEMLQAAVKESPSDNRLHIELASALREQKKYAEALGQLQKVTQDLDLKQKAGGDKPQQSMMMMGGGNPDAAMRFQLATEYEQLNRKDLAQKERSKIKAPGGGASPFGGPGGASPGMGSPIGGGTITIPPH